MSDIFFSPYRISTITCNANIGNDININLGLLFDNINIIEKGYVQPVGKKGNAILYSATRLGLKKLETDNMMWIIMTCKPDVV